MRALILLVWAVAGGLLCGTAVAGNPPASFSDRLEGDAAGTVVVGSRVNLSWAATAQFCTYAGSTFPPGVRFDDWPTDPSGGTTAPACSGFASCASPHSYTFFLGTPGAYHFQVNCLTSGGPAVTSSLDVLAVEAPSADSRRAQPVGEHVRAGAAWHTVQLHRRAQQQRWFPPDCPYYHADVAGRNCPSSAAVAPLPAAVR